MSDFRSRPNYKGASAYAQRIDKHEQWAQVMWRVFWIGLGLFVLSIILFSFTTPSFRQLEDPSFNLASEVIAGDDTTVLGRIYIENRAPVTYNKLPKHLVAALIATEDKRFLSHSGIDPEAMARVVKNLVPFQGKQGGGSTLSMQLAKLLYSDRNFGNANFMEKAFGYYYRKLREMVTAIKLERAYTKEEIMEMYLNKYDFGYSAYGIRAASEVFFNKTPDQLTLEEAATFVAMCNNSSLFNPIRRNERTRNRRNLVLERMVDAGFLKRAEADAAKKKALDVSNFKTRTHNDGLATYFRSTIADEIKKIIKEQGLTKADGTPYDVYRDGLKIYTTIDDDMQRLAEEAMREHMSALQAKYFKVWRGRDPWTYKDEETTDGQIAIRKATLDAQVRNSDRYQMMRGKVLDELVQKIETEYELEFYDSDIVNMLQEERKAGSLDGMIKNASLNPRRAGVLRDIMKGDSWAEIKKRWNALQAQVRTDFNKPVKMKVFAYTPNGEKDTTMTPLDSLRYLRMHLQIGSMGVDPQTGFVKFWLGGIGHKYFQYDHVKSDRQVGSTFKPFVYATALHNGMSPCKPVHDVAQTIGVGEGNFGLSAPWTPKNSGGYSGSWMTLWDALKESKNTASVALLKELGSTQPIREIVNELGIDVNAKVANGQLRVPKNPAICLGAVDLKVFEMTGAFTAFANQGTFVRPLYIRRITSSSGRLLYQGLPETRGAIPKNVAYSMLQMLKYNLRGAGGFKDIKSEVGGKTGTTNDYRDGWFMGVSPNLVVGTWVGGEDQWIRFLTIADGQGSAMARPFFSKTLAKIEKNVAGFDPMLKFTKPEGELGIVLDCDLYHETSPSGLPVESVPTEFDPNRFQDEEQSIKSSAPASPPPATPTTGTKPAATTPTAPAPVKKKPKPADDGFGG